MNQEQQLPQTEKHQSQDKGELLKSKETPVRIELKFSDFATEKQMEQLHDEFYADYACSVHVPKDMLEGEDQPGVTEVKRLCRDSSVVKIVQIHGWNATKKIWELDSQEENWTAELMRKYSEQGIPVIVINVDSNGWGDSPLSEEGKAILNLGFDALFLSRNIIRNKKKRIKELTDSLEDDSSLDSETNEEIEMLRFEISLAQDILYSRKLPQDIDLNSIKDPILQEYVEEAQKRGTIKGSKLASMTKNLTDPYKRRNFPGSVEHAAKVMELLRDDVLPMEGLVGWVGHSQGAKIITEIFEHGKDNKNLQQFALFVEGALTGKDLRRSDVGRTVIRFLDLLNSSVGKILLRAGKLFSINTGIGSAITRIIAASRLDPGVGSELSTEIHGTQVTEENIPLITYQALEWSLPHIQQAFVNGRYFLGSNDTVIPPEAVRAWIRFNALSGGTGVRDRHANTFMDYEHFFEFLDGPHYAHTKKENQSKAIDALVNTTSVVREFERNEEIELVLDSFSQYQGYYMFLVVKNDRSLETPLLERLQQAFSLLKKGMSERNLFLSLPIPVSQEELMALSEHPLVSLNSRTQKITRDESYRSFMYSHLSDSLSKKYRLNQVSFLQSTLVLISKFPFMLFLDKEDVEFRRYFTFWFDKQTEQYYKMRAGTFDQKDSFTYQVFCQDAKKITIDYFFELKERMKGKFQLTDINPSSALYLPENE